MSNIVKKLPGAANNWARGFYSEGEKVIDQIMNVIDSAVQKTQSLQGFMVTHSIGGLLVRVSVRSSFSGSGKPTPRRKSSPFPWRHRHSFRTPPWSRITRC